MCIDSGVLINIQQLTLQDGGGWGREALVCSFTSSCGVNTPHHDQIDGPDGMQLNLKLEGDTVSSAQGAGREEGCVTKCKHQNHTQNLVAIASTTALNQHPLPSKQSSLSPQLTLLSDDSSPTSVFESLLFGEWLPFSAVCIASTIYSTNGYQEPLVQPLPVEASSR